MTNYLFRIEEKPLRNHSQVTLIRDYEDRIKTFREVVTKLVKTDESNLTDLELLVRLQDRVYLLESIIRRPEYYKNLCEELFDSSHPEDLKYQMIESAIANRMAQYEDTIREYKILTENLAKESIKTILKIKHDGLAFWKNMPARRVEIDGVLGKVEVYLDNMDEETMVISYVDGIKNKMIEANLLEKTKTYQEKIEEEALEAFETFQSIRDNPYDDGTEHARLWNEAYIKRMNQYLKEKD